MCSGKTLSMKPSSEPNLAPWVIVYQPVLWFSKCRNKLRSREVNCSKNNNLISRLQDLNLVLSVLIACFLLTTSLYSFLFSVLGLVLCVLWDHVIFKIFVSFSFILYLLSSFLPRDSSVLLEIHRWKHIHSLSLQEL